MDPESAKQRLLDRLAELNSLAEQTRDDRAPVELDQTSVGRLSRMDALQVQAMDQEKDRRRQVEQERIKSALARIESDDFGYCVVCDEEIEEKRLEHDPSVPTCVGCAAGNR